MVFDFYNLNRGIGVGLVYPIITSSLPAMTPPNYNILQKRDCSSLKHVCDALATFCTCILSFQNTNREMHACTCIFMMNAKIKHQFLWKAILYM